MKRLLLCLLALCCTAAAQTKAQRGPVIDMHMHASAPTDYGPPHAAMCTPITMPVWDQRQPYEAVMADFYLKPTCKDPVIAPATEADLRNETLRAMKTSHVVLGVLSGSPKLVAKWKAAAPAGAFLSGIDYDPVHVSLDTLKKLHSNKQLDILAEITTQYEGIAPTDSRLDPVWSLAEQLDIPVGIHIGPGPPGVAYAGATGMRARLSSALTMEEVLIKHPKLRVYLMHAGFPMIDELLAVLYNHPQVYVDTGVIVYTQPRPAFYDYLKRITDAGFGKRILFGSDQMAWPGTIERSIRVIEQDPYLTAPQKRDILYNNAARFLRLPDANAKH